MTSLFSVERLIISLWLIVVLKDSSNLSKIPSRMITLFGKNEWMDEWMNNLNNLSIISESLTNMNSLTTFPILSTFPSSLAYLPCSITKKLAPALSVVPKATVSAVWWPLSLDPRISPEQFVNHSFSPTMSPMPSTLSTRISTSLSTVVWWIRESPCPTLPTRIWPPQRYQLR